MPAAETLIFAWLNVPIGWLLVGSGLALATIGLVSLLRTRWRYVKAWKKCALLSFWVHLLLAYVATVIQVASSGLGIGPGDGPGPPIEVALVTTEITPLDEISSLVTHDPASDEESEEDVDTQKPEPREVETAEAEEPPAEVSTPFQAPELIPEPTPAEAVAPEPAPDRVEEPSQEASLTEEPQPTLAPAPEPADTSTLPAAKSTATPLPKTSDAASPTGGDADSATGPTASKPDEASSSSSEPAPANAAPVPDAYADRFAPNRSQLVAGGGGNANTERAVQAALAWLAAAQSEEGRWDPKRHGAGQERYTLGQDRGGAGAKADTGISGLALLAFLGAGHSHREGPYATEVARGLDFLRRAQKSNGNLCGDAELFAQTYCHSMASFAVGEAYALTKDKRLDPIVRAATAYSLAIQHPTDGGWRYRPGDTGDTSQLGWQVMSLKSAELAGLPVPDVTWTRVDRFLRRVARGQAGGLAVYRPEEALPSRPMTAEALYCRQLATGRPDGGLTPAGLKEAIDSLLKERPSLREVNLYYWYYGTLALHRAQAASPQAGEAWRQWNEALTTTLLVSQNEDGSWPATCIWGGYGGRVYTTALGAMCLEVYYRYAPADSNRDVNDVAGRADDVWK